MRASKIPEIAALPDRRRLFFFVDDNVVAHPREAKELFRALVPLGCFTEEKRLVLKVLTTSTLTPVCEPIAALQAQFPGAEALLKGWQAANPAMQKVLHDDVARGLKSRYEAPQTDTDFPSSD